MLRVVIKKARMGEINFAVCQPQYIYLAYGKPAGRGEKRLSRLLMHHRYGDPYYFWQVLSGCDDPAIEGVGLLVSTALKGLVEDGFAVYLFLDVEDLLNNAHKILEKDGGKR